MMIVEDDDDGDGEGNTDDDEVRCIQSVKLRLK